MRVTVIVELRSLTQFAVCRCCNMNKKCFRWRRQSEERYGLDPTKQNPDNEEVLEAAYFFAESSALKQDEKYMIAAKNESELGKANPLNFVFRSDYLKSNAVGMHAKRSAKYEKAASEDEREFSQLALIVWKTKDRRRAKTILI